MLDKSFFKIRGHFKTSMCMCVCVCICCCTCVVWVWREREALRWCICVYVLFLFVSLRPTPRLCLSFSLCLFLSLSLSLSASYCVYFSLRLYISSVSYLHQPAIYWTTLNYFSSILDLFNEIVSSLTRRHYHAPLHLQFLLHTLTHTLSLCSCLSHTHSHIIHFITAGITVYGGCPCSRKLTRIITQCRQGLARNFVPKLALDGKRTYTHAQHTYTDPVFSPVEVVFVFNYSICGWNKQQNHNNVL